jgi:hypothetical protein
LIQGLRNSRKKIIRVKAAIGFKMKVHPAINKLRDGLRNDLLIVLLGSVVISFLAGYFISRRQEAQKREQWAEILFRHAKDWLSSTAEQASSKGVQYGQRLNPFYREPRRRFLDII